MTSRLYVIACISNPVRYKARYALYEKFAKHMADSGVILYTIEMAFGDRPHQVTQNDNPRHIQVRSSHELWHKENLINIAISRLPSDWEYVAWVDADVMFHRPDWANETVEQLQHYGIVQLFSHSIDLNPAYEPVGTTHVGFVHNYYHGQLRENGNGYAAHSHPGYAWAARRDMIDATGGLIEHGILGSADTNMACAMIGQAAKSYNPGVHPNYKKVVHEWESRCAKYLRRNVGYVSGTISHFWHGTKQNRLYNDRWKILVDHQFDPLADVYRDSQGLLQLHADRIELRDAVRRYFRSRQEDCIYTGEYKLLP